MERTDAEDFAGSERLNLGFANGDDGDGFARGSEDFQGVTRFLSRTAGVSIDDGGDVAALEAVFGQVGCESHPSVGFVSHR